MLASGNPMMSQQLFQNQNQAYAGGFSGSYEGWPGMALKQIMGQIDLFNFQNSSNSYNSGPEKWQINMESNNSAQESSGFNSECMIKQQQASPEPQQQQQQQQQQQPKQQQQQLPQNFKSQNEFKSIANFQCQEQPAETTTSSSAWLGPQLWNTQIGVDVSAGDLPAIQNGNGSLKRKRSIDRDVRWFDRTLKMIQDESDELISEEKQANLEEEFSSADLALASAPGIYFDPRTRCFSPEELKPQPIIRKRSKLYVSDTDKTENYWAKRVTNNVAARRSREARRLKENQIALRAAFLERENSSLRNQVQSLNDINEDMKKDVEQLKKSIQELRQMDQTG